MNFKYQLLIVGVVLVAYVSVAAGLKCIVCSPTDDNCDTGNVEDTYKKDCNVVGGFDRDSATYLCYKTRTAYAKNSSQESVRRGCTGSAYEIGCHVIDSYLGYVNEVCTCDGDNCNSSTQLAGSTFFALALASIRMLLG